MLDSLSLEITVLYKYFIAEPYRLMIYCRKLLFERNDKNHENYGRIHETPKSTGKRADTGT